MGILKTGTLHDPLILKTSLSLARHLAFAWCRVGSAVLTARASVGDSLRGSLRARASGNSAASTRSHSFPDP